jgi:hypothetical protein
VAVGIIALPLVEFVSGVLDFIVERSITEVGCIASAMV